MGRLQGMSVVIDRAVKRLRLRPVPPYYKVPHVTYKCLKCRFTTKRLTAAWAHSCTHMPQSLEGSQGHAYAQMLSARARALPRTTIRDYSRPVRSEAVYVH